MSSSVGSLYGLLVEHFYIDTVSYLVFEAMSALLLYFLVLATTTWVAAKILFPDSRYIPKWRSCIPKLIGLGFWLLLAVFVLIWTGVPYQDFLSRHQPLVSVVGLGIIVTMINIFVFGIVGMAYPLIVLGEASGVLAAFRTSFKLLRKKPIRTMISSAFVLASVELFTLLLQHLPQVKGIDLVSDAGPMTLFGPLWIIAVYVIWRGQLTGMPHSYPPALQLGDAERTTKHDKHSQIT